MGDEHIVCVTEVNTVEVDRGKGVKSLELQHHVIGKRRIEGSFVHGCGVLYPTVFIVIVSVENVLYNSRRDKIGVHTSGNSCGECFFK